MSRSTLGDKFEVTFEDGSFISSVVRLEQKGVLEAIVLPEGWKATTLSLLAVVDSADEYKKVYNADGNRICIVTEAKRFIPLSSKITRGINFLKFEREGNVGQSTIKTIIRYD